MNDPTTVYVERASGGTYNLIVSKYWPGTTFLGYPEIFIKKLLGDKKPLKESNRRRVEYFLLYNIKCLVEDWHRYEYIVDPKKFYIITKTIDGWRMSLDRPSFDTEEQAKAYMVEKDMVDWLYEVCEGKRVLRFHDVKYYTVEESKAGKEEILQKLEAL